jgi:Lamin Tail Domain
VATQPPAETPAVEAPVDDGWTTVKSFSGKDGTTTPAFHISGNKWRITWTVDTQDPDHAVFNALVYEQNRSGVPVGTVAYSPGVPPDAVIIDEGGHDYYLKIIAANLDKWTLDIEDYASQTPEQPVQITEIHYKAAHYMLVEEVDATDPNYEEYVEIKNFSDSPQIIAGWELKNITKGPPSFVFPMFTPCSCSYLESRLKCLQQCYPPHPCAIEPRQSIRVYTEQPHWESGGYCFYQYPGDIWDDETSNTAVLYNAQGQEVSRRSYVPAKNNTAKK